VQRAIKRISESLNLSKADEGQKDVKIKLLQIWT